MIFKFFKNGKLIRQYPAKNECILCHKIKKKKELYTMPSGLNACLNDKKCTNARLKRIAKAMEKFKGRFGTS